MWGEQCNQCGGHENSARSVATCSFCPTRICNGCKANHESVCEENQKRKRRGEGPTVRRLAPPVLEVPDGILSEPIVDVSSTPFVEPDPFQTLLGEAAENLTLDPATAQPENVPVVSDLIQIPFAAPVDVDAVNAELAAAEESIDGTQLNPPSDEITNDDIPF